MIKPQKLRRWSLVPLFAVFLAVRALVPLIARIPAAYASDESCGALATATAPQGATLRLEVAATPEQQEHGFMDRTEIDPDGGMIFVFPRLVHIGFWMVDTPMPLSVAFLEADGTILDIQDMEPYSETVHLPEDRFRLAIETNRGWFERHNVTAGDKLKICLPTG